MKRTLLLPSADGDDDDNNNESLHPADKRRLSGQDYPESAAVHESPTDDDDDDGTVIIDILSMNDDELKEFGNDIEADHSVSTLIDDKESLIDCDDEEIGVDDQESPDNSPSMITDQINKENSEAPLGFSGFVRTHDAMAPGPFLNSEPSQDGGHVIVKPIVVPGVAPHSLPIPNLSNWMNTGHRIFFSPYTMFDGHPMMPPALRGSPLPGATSFYQPSPMAPHMNPGGRCFGPRIIQGNPWSIPRMSREQFNKPCMPPNEFMNFMETGGFRATNGPQPPPPLPPPSAAAYMASSNASNMAAAQALAAVFSQPIPERFQHYHHPQHQRQAPPGFVNQIRKRFPVMSFNREKCENRRSRPRREDGNYIKKPLNAFMLFMREERPKMIDRGSLRESAAINKILGRKWHGLSREEQAKYYEMAREERVKHMTRFPGWSARDNYGSKKRRRSTRDRCRVTDFSTPEQARKCRARYGSEKVELWCKACRRKKKCIRFSGLENEAERPLYDPSAPTHDKASCDSNKENPAEDDHAIIQDEAFIASSPELLDICTDVSGEDDDDDNDNHSSPNGTLIPTTQDHEHSKYLEQT